MTKKQDQYPETEMDYWRNIDGLGGAIWQIKHSVYHGRITADDALVKGCADMQKKIEQLVTELFELFGVIHPKDQPKIPSDKALPKAPVGMIWYRDWYYKMKNEFHQEEYEKIICSACPLSIGIGEFISSDSVPCSIFFGRCYHLKRPDECAMTKRGGGKWNREYLFDKIREKGGDEAVEKFWDKERVLALLDKRKFIGKCSNPNCELSRRVFAVEIRGHIQEGAFNNEPPKCYKCESPIDGKEKEPGEI
ncbi:hypothetical protein ACFL08_03850 [Patescibacteria group bacterium]